MATNSVRVLIWTFLAGAMAQYGNSNTATSASFALASAATTPTSTGSSSVHTVNVGSGGTLAFSPNSLTAAIGDQVEFHFTTSTPPHSVAQGSFENPCQPSNASAFYSGFVTDAVSAPISIMRQRYTLTDFINTVEAIYGQSQQHRSNLLLLQPSWSLRRRHGWSYQPSVSRRPLCVKRYLACRALTLRDTSDLDRVKRIMPLPRQVLAGLPRRPTSKVEFLLLQYSHPLPVHRLRQLCLGQQP